MTHPLAMGLDLTEKKARRALFMRRLYELSDGDAMAFVKYHDFAGEYGWTTDEADAVAHYLKAEGLLKFPAFGSVVSITHRGVIEVEELLEHPDTPTEHFPSMNVVLVQGDVHHSQLAAGEIVSQQLTVSADQAGDLRLLIDAIRGLVGMTEVDAENGHQIEADLATIEAQLRSPNPKHIVLRESVRSLRSIAENLVASGIWVAIPEVLHKVSF
jgi:hypothetical protein